MSVGFRLTARSMAPVSVGGISSEEFEALTERQRRKNFVKVATSHGAWRIAAQQLLTSARIICQSIGEAEKRELDRDGTHSAGNNCGTIVVGSQEWNDMWIENSSIVAAMLFGMATECLLKGAIVERERLQPDAKGRFKIKEGHGIARLAKRAGVATSVNEERLLQFLETCVVWKGRYMVPLTVDLYLRDQASNEVDGRVSTWPIDRFQSRVNEFIARVLSQFPPRTS